MNILVLTGQLHPVCNNNTNMICKLLAALRHDHAVHLAAPVFGEPAALLPERMHGCCVHWIMDGRKDPVRKFIYPALAKIMDPNGYSDFIQAMLIARRLKEIRKEYHYDMVISTMETFPSACAALLLPKQVRKVLYIMDPPACICNPASETSYRHRMLPKILAGHDLILTTPFIRRALDDRGYGRFDHKIAEVGFPMIEPHTYQPTSDDIVMDKTKINLLFCGWLYSDIRSPKYFLDIAARLDERFCIYFMGKECDKLRERFSFETRAQVITLPQQPYQVALNAMADADILINIGNSVPVHMPSKTLEYINTGKPMVNFHKLPDCPTLHYTKRYPLCLNLWEGDPNVTRAAADFIDFCTKNKGESVDTASLSAQFPECTPEYIANLILNKIGAHYE